MTKDDWEMESKLRERFIKLWVRSHALGDPEALFTDLCKRYKEPGRHYHVLEHLAYCFAELDQVRQYIEDIDAVEYFIFYHDAVYSFVRKGNEERSAVLFVSVGRKAGLPDQFIYKVTRYIRASQFHRADPVRDSDLAFALDIDMSILGADPVAYDLYARAIRKEYCAHSNFEFRDGRTKWITATLLPENQPIFLTQAFEEKYELRAEQNLNAELVRLRSQS